MPIQIILTPDIYFRNWDERLGGTAGEMWLVLRPMIAAGRITEKAPLGDSLDDFFGWARSPHFAKQDGDPAKPDLYAFKSPHELGLGAGRCSDDDSYLPITLPSDIDLQIRIGRTDNSEEIIDIPRTRACKVILGDKETEDAFGDPNQPGSDPQVAFARAFNKNTADKINALWNKSEDLLKSVFLYAQQMETGRRFRLMAGRVGEPYDVGTLPMPVLENPVSASGPVTSVYWFLGQMIRLGTQQDIARLRTIDRVDIVLSAYGRQLDVIPFPDAQGGPEDALRYFEKVGDNFARSLECALESRDRLTYVAPGFRGVQPGETSGGERIWILEQTAERDAKDAAAGTPAQLHRLAAVEVRGRLNKAPDSQTEPPVLAPIGDDIQLVPGLLVSGSLKPYRRYPMLTATAADVQRRVTVLLFEPDPSVARELDALHKTLPEADFRTLFTSRVGDWAFSLLHAGALPWDGSRTRFRVLAEPKANLKVAPGEPLMCDLSSLTLFMPALQKKTLPAAKVEQGRSLWRADRWQTGPSSPQALAALWAREAGEAWATLRFNALKVSGLIDPDQTAINLMMIDEFTLQAADSCVRMEKILSTVARSPRTAALASVETVTDPRNLDPLRDYEDDYVNQNSAHVLYEEAGSTKTLGPRILRSPQRSETQPDQCRIANVNRRQTIPLLHSWPGDPLNRPQDEWPDTITWQDVRAEVALRYGLSDDAEAGPFSIDLEHTYGDRERAADATGAPISFLRTDRRDWPVQLPTYVESAEQPAKRFIQCRYVPTGSGSDVIELVFDLGLLQFPALDAEIFKTRKDGRPSPQRSADESNRRLYSTALSAWRALAELASPKSTISLHIQRTVFSLDRALSDLAAPAAASLARDGFPEGWAGGVQPEKPIDIDRHSELTRLRDWARQTLGGGNLPATMEFSFALPAGQSPGKSAHLIRIDVRAARDPSQAPAAVASQVLVPISQQPGLYWTRDHTMQAAWAGLGFGPTLETLDEGAAGPVWPALEDSQKNWTQDRTAVSDSISPEPLPPLDPEDEEELKARELQTALIARLVGTDWFAPAGEGPRPDTRTVQPLLLPIGFAPCQPHATLKGVTQTALQRFSSALRDAVDLAYVHWTGLGATAYAELFGRIAGLATRDEKDWAGPLASFSDLLVQRLIYPEPDETDDGNEDRIRALASAVRHHSGDLAHLGLAVRRRLLEDPALFADAKALLLTALEFKNDTSAGATPPPTALAGGRFMRRTDAVDARDGASALKTSNLTLANLILAGTTGETSYDRRFGFLEVLDDTGYADTFHIPERGSAADPADFIVESYEEKIDPASPQGPWPQLAPIVPLAAANQPGARVVHLASRSLVVPPLAQPLSRTTDLDQALQAADAPALAWGLENLREGLPGPSATALKMIARRQRVASPAAIEFDTAYMLFTVTGDEEQALGLLAAFQNDSFFIELQPSHYPAASQPPQLAGAARTVSPAEPLLRELAFAERGSARAASAVERLAFPTAGHNFATQLNEFIHPFASPLPARTFALLRSETGGSPVPIGAYGPDAGPTLDLLREAALFGPDSAATPGGPRIGYLLLGFETSVWAPLEARFAHGRNVPRDRWIGGAGDADTPRFAPEFWQSAAQEGLPSRHALLDRGKGNSPSDWQRKSHVATLAPGWRAARSPRDLMHELLFRPGLTIGDHQSSAGILDPDSRHQLFSQELSIQVYHEQFLADPDEPGVLPFSRLASPRNALIAPNPQTEPAPRIWFDRQYDHFSVDLHWSAPNGARLLTLDRLFIRFQ